MHFAFTSPQGEAFNNANVFELETVPEARVSLLLNGQSVEATMAELCRGSRILWYRDECVAAVEKLTGTRPHDCPRDDPFYHLARKAKIHRAIPSSGYEAELSFQDDEPLPAQDREM